MLWTCRICKSADNRGLQKHCVTCGKPKDERDVERFPDDLSEDNALSGEAKRKALAGPDWSCKFCGTLQNSLGRCCGECGADRNTGAKDWGYLGETKVVQNVETGERRVVPRPSKKARIDVDPFREPKPFTGQTLPEEAPAPAQDFVPDTGGYRDPPKVREATPTEFVQDTGGYRTPPKIRYVPAPWRLPSWVPKLTVSFLIAGAVLLVLWLIFRTKVVDARVTAVSWQHDVVIDRYQVYRKEGWDADPGAFEVNDEGRRVHHYDHVQVGSHQESYQESYTCGENCTTIRGTCTTSPRTCTSNKNGTATCTGGDRTCSPDTRSCTPKTCTRTARRTVPDYEDQPRYRTWYSWKVWEWGYNRTVRASGSSMDTRWPADSELQPVSLAPGEQERNRRQESYTVVFSDSKDSWTIRPRSESSFHRFPPGSRFKLKVGIANGVTVLGSNGSSEDY